MRRVAVTRATLLSRTLTSARCQCRASLVRSHSSATGTMPRHIPVYTRTGDTGTSSLFNMERKPKDDPHFAALGDCDELNANVGHAREFCVSQRDLNELVDQLEEIESRLFDVGSHIATPRPSSSENQTTLTAFDDVHIESLERWIDAMDAELPPLKNFILPSGGLASTQLHIARAVCRRAERSVIPLIESGDTERVIQKYLNRLSDFLFVAARFAALRSGNDEIIWRKPRRSEREAMGSVAGQTEVRRNEQ